MKKESNLCNIYILLWLVSFFQNTLGAGSFTSLLVSVPQMLITLFCFVTLLANYRIKGSMASWMVFFLLLLIYGGIAILGGKSTSFFTMTTASVGPMIAFYYFTLKGYLIEKHLIFWFFVFIITSIVSYYDNQAKVFERMAQNYYYSFEEITNNVSYTFVGLLPFIFLFKKRPLLQYGLLALILYYSIIGIKRGAIIVAAIMLIWFVYNSTRGIKKNRRWLVISLSVVLIIFGFLFISYFYSTSNYFQMRFESTLEGDSSKRDMIYITLWNHFVNNTNIIEMFFGNGAFYTTSIVSGENAHNDWLELLIDCGIVGVFIYFVFWFNIFKEWYKTKQDTLIYCMLGSCLIYCFIKTLISQGFSSMPFHVSMIMGYCIAHIRQHVVYT